MLRTAIVLLTAGTLTFAAATVPSMFQQMEAPAPEHANLQKMVGEWEGTITMTMPGMPEMKSDAKETVRSNGPFWTTSDFHSEFMGMPYHGHGCHGYSPEMGKFRSTWIDNFSTGIVVSEGKMVGDEGGHTLRSEFMNPMNGESEKIRMVTRYVDEDNHIFEYYVTNPAGQEFRQMVIEYTRLK